MSLYEVARLCRAVNTDQDLVAALLADPVAAVAPYDLTEWERETLLAGDVAALHRHGVHGLLLSYLSHEPVLGLDVATYSSRMREAFGSHR